VRETRRDLLLLALLGALLFLPGLGRRDLWNPDEARYAEVAREMRLFGAWAVPRLNGEVYTQKPPLLFWSMNATALLTGRLDETSARIPLALSAIVSLLLVYRIGERLFSRRAAWIAVAAYATCLRVLWQGRFGQIDMLLAVFVTLAVWFWVRGATERKPHFYYLFFLSAGLATLAKGPVGLLPPLLSILAFLLLTGHKSEIRRLHLGTGLLLWAAIVLAWLVPAGLSGGREYLDQILYKQNVTRYAEPWHHHQPFYYYLTVIPAEYFPWSFLLPTALILGWRRLVGGRAGLRHLRSTTEARGSVGPVQATGSMGGGKGGAHTKEPSRADRTPGPAAILDPRDPGRGFLFALCWMVVTLLFFSLSSGKRSVYVLTLYPAMALMTGAALDHLAAHWPRDRRWLTVPFATLFSLVLLLVVALPIAGRGRPEAEPMGGDRLVWLVTATFLPLLLGAAWAWWEARAGRAGRAAAALAAGMGTLMLLTALVLLPRFDAVKSARSLSRELLARLGPGDTYGIYPRLDSTFLFYTRRFAVDLNDEAKLQEFVRRPGRIWLLIQRDEIAKLKQPLPPLTEVARDADVREGYVLLTRPAPR
jgi:4-amino-4-deoxy-L-arabinose transferase-like glycosyltransferase